MPEVVFHKRHRTTSLRLSHIVVLCWMIGTLDSGKAFAFSTTTTARWNGVYRREICAQRVSMATRSQLISLSMSAKDTENNVIDAVIETREEEKETEEVKGELAPPQKNQRKRDTFRSFIRKLASLSLEDYKWRSNVFKSNEADRKIEESLARMMGEEPTYVRPMDASEDKLGPLGNAEKKAVQWLSSVIEEEGKRAKKIAEGDNIFVRPMDVGDSPNTDDDDDNITKNSNNNEIGTLSQLERRAVSFFQKIADSETARITTGKIRPMELEESKRGPLGDAEAKAVLAWEELTVSEQLRFKQQLKREEVVRPIDVPGPLGEMERAALDVVQAELQRSKDREVNQGRIVRPKDASMDGPLGKAEQKFVDAMERLKVEEEDRWMSIQKLLFDRRPMNNDRESALGLTEALVVGILRGPKLLVTVYDRVKELMQSENLSKDEQKLLTESKTNEDGDKVNR